MNALNSILSYIQRPKAINIMESLGIDVFADEARTQFRGAMEIFQDIERNWSTASDAIKDGFIEAAEDADLFNEELTEAIGMMESWTDVQKRDLAQGAAGVFRRNYFIGMIERLANAQGVLNGLMTAGGYSQAENERTMDSLEKKVQSLKTSVTQLAVALGDAGLLEMLKSIADGTGAVVGAFNKAPAGMKDFLISALSVMAVVKTLDVGMKLLGISSIPNVSAAITKLTKLIYGLATGQVVLTAATEKATIATKKFLSVNAGLLILSAVIGLIAAGANAYKKHKEEAEKAAEVARQNVADLNSEIDTLQKLQTEYNNLLPKSEDNVEARKRMLEIQKELAKLHPTLISGLDEEGNAIAANTERVNELTEAKKKQLEQELFTLNSIAQRELPGLKSTLDSVNEEIESLIEKLESGDTKTWSNYLQMDIDKAPEYAKRITELIGKRKELTEKIETHINIEQQYAQVAKASVDAFIDGAGSVKAYKEALDDLVDGQKDTISEIAELNQAIHDATEGKSLSAQEALNLIEKYDLTADAVSKTTDGYKIEISVLKDLREQKLSTTLSNIENAKAEAEAVRDATISNLSSYGLEIEMLKTIAKAKLATARSGVDIYKRLEEEGIATGSPWLRSRDTELIKLAETLEELERLDKQAEMLKGVISDPTYGVKTSKGTSSAQKAMDDRLKQAVDWINYQKSIGELTLQQEIAAWMKILDEQSGNIEAVKTATTNLYKLRQQLADEDAKLQERHIKHLTTLGVYSIQEQIDAYREMYKVRAETLADEQNRVENLFSLYKQLLSEQLSAIKKAYDERIKMIDDEADKQKEALQDRIAGLKEELDLLGRKDKERSYEQTIAGIQEEIAYWQVRVSEEARKKVIELEEKLDEERYKKQLEDEKQAINDKIDALEDEVKDVDRIAKEERAKWEQSYKKIEESFNGHSANIVALAASMSKDAFDQWLNNYFIPLQTALSSGSFGTFDSIASGGFGVATITHDWGMSETDYRRFLDNGERWAELNRQGYSSATNVEMRKLNEENDQLRKKYGRDVSLGEYPKFHTGGKTLSYGIARYKPGELVFPPNLAEKLEMLIAILGHQNFGKQAVNGDKTVKIGTLLNIEKNLIEDDADLTILAREMARAVQRI